MIRALTFVAVVLSPVSALAEISAADVTDRASLKAFVEQARDYMQAVTTLEEASKFRRLFSTEGRWKDGDMYIALLDWSGSVLIHGESREWVNLDAIPVTDDNNKPVTAEFISLVREAGEGFVDYVDGGQPKTAYATVYTSGLSGKRLVIVGGWSLSLADATYPIPDLPRPEVTADEVVDKETLIKFVRSAAETYRSAMAGEDYRFLAGTRAALVEEGGYWKQGSVYIWMVDASGTIILHGFEPFRVGEKANFDRVDINGVPFAQLLLGGAIENGSVFAEYMYDNPVVEGDEDTGSPKLGYAVSFVPPGWDPDQKYVVGSGIYVHREDAATDDGPVDVATAWLARFGRTVADQVLDALDARMRSPQTEGMKMAVAGRAVLPAGPGVATAGLDDVRQPVGSALTRAELLEGSSFEFTGRDGDGGAYSLWGSGAVSSFRGRAGNLELDGDVAGALFGADRNRGPVTFGMMIGHSIGDGTYGAAADGGDIESTLTGIYPWASYVVSPRITVWGLAGYGTGSLTLTPTGQSAMRTDMDMTMGAVGVRGTLMEAHTRNGGVNLAVKGDAIGVRTTSDRTGGLSAADADVTRIRLGLEGSRSFSLEGGAQLTPSVEFGVRRDDGDAETGAGVDVVGGIAWSDPAHGMAVSLQARKLIDHESEGTGHHGLMGSITWEPSPDRGPSLTLRQSVGGWSSGGMHALFARRAPDNVSRADRSSLDPRTDLSLGYGMMAFGGFRVTPEVGVGLSASGRDYSAGWRLAVLDSLSLSVRAVHHDAAADGTDDDRVGMTFGARW